MRVHQDIRLTGNDGRFLLEPCGVVRFLLRRGKPHDGKHAAGEDYAQAQREEGDLLSFRLHAARRRFVRFLFGRGLRGDFGRFRRGRGRFAQKRRKIRIQAFRHKPEGFDIRLGLIVFPQ